MEPLPGAIVTQFIRCGKPACRCSRGQPHGPYFYRVWREDGRVRKAYVKATKVEGVRRQTRLYEECAAELKRLTHIRQSLSRSLAAHRALRRALSAEIGSAEIGSAEV